MEKILGLDSTGILFFEEITMDQTTKIKNELEKAGYKYAVAVATQAEIDAGAACGQLAIIIEKRSDDKISS